MKIGYVVVMSDARNLGPGSADRWPVMRDKALRAEDAGYDSLWVYDHLLYRQPDSDVTVGIWEGWTIMSALAAVTNRVEIGSLVLCNQFRNPAILAKMAHTLDEVSGGRIILGIGAGWNRAEFDAFGLPFDHRVARLEEALQILKPLLAEGHVDFDGTYYSVRDCEITPTSPRTGGPPLMVGAFGPKTIRLAARYADMWNTAYWADPEDAAEQIAIFDDAVADEAPAATPHKTMLTAVVFKDLLLESVEIPGTTIDGGEPGAIAAALDAHEAAGIAHVQLHPVPNTDEAITRMEQGLHEWKNR